MRLILTLMLLLGAVGCNQNNSQISSSQPGLNQGTASQSKSEPSGSSVTEKSAASEKKPEEWRRSEKTDQMDGHKTVTFEMRSTNDIRFSDIEGTPSIAISCGKDLDVSLGLRGGVTSPIIRYKLDESATITDRWYDSPFSMSTSAPEDLLKQMMRAKTFKIEFTPVGSGTQIASFNLGNLKEVIQREKACDIRKRPRFP